MSDERRAVAERQLRALRAPDEYGAEQRAWAVVRTVYDERATVPRRRPRWRFALAPAALVLTGALVLTPAGAAVQHWIDRTLGVPRASTSLFSLPSPGRLLVSGPGGTWTVGADGARRRLGPWEQATWSPRGLYVGVAGTSELAAVDGRGTVRWSVARPAVRFPSWFSPNGYRVAYLSGTTLRVIAGDGTADRQLAGGVALTPPAWRPGHRYQLAYGSAGGAVVVRDADTGAVLWSRPLASEPRSLAWSVDGGHLVVVLPTAVLILDSSGRTVARLDQGASRSPLDAALSPDGHTVAVLHDGEVTLTTMLPRAATPRRIFFAGSGLRQLAWSPDGQWLLVSWPAANQWVFIHATGRPRLAAISHIAEQFTTGTAQHGFPQLDGWCCTTPAGSG